MINKNRTFDYVEIRELNGVYDAWAINKDLAAYLVRDGVVAISGSEQRGFLLSIERYPEKYDYKEVISTRSEAERKQNEFAYLIHQAHFRSVRENF